MKLRRMSSSSTGEKLLLLAGVGLVAPLHLHLLPASRPRDVGCVLRVRGVAVGLQEATGCFAAPGLVSE